ncbi:MAG TPA: SCO family protein, partial [Bacteroidia bacterium]|nr:SCO family protein [Bacteroidia bacterium]
MKVVHSEAVRSAQYSRLRTAYCALIYCVLIVACSPQPEQPEVFGFGGIPRLAKYYPVVDAHGDTTYKTIPSDTFINQHGQPFITGNLAGNISVVQVFFTSCEGICPVISYSMGQVQKEFKGNANVNLVS